MDWFHSEKTKHLWVLLSCFIVLENFTVSIQWLVSFLSVSCDVARSRVDCLSACLSIALILCVFPPNWMFCLTDVSCHLSLSLYWVHYSNCDHFQQHWVRTFRKLPQTLQQAFRHAFQRVTSVHEWIRMAWFLIVARMTHPVVCGLRWKYFVNQKIVANESYAWALRSSSK